MTLASPIMKWLAPSMIRSVVISMAALIIGLLILFLGALPERTALRVAGDEAHTLDVRLNQMRATVATAEHQKQACDKPMAERDALVASGVIEPLLGSFSMRGKNLLDPIARQTGFHIDGVRELQPIPLQLPKPAPEQLHYRQPVEFTGQGSYTQITAFITQVEASQPLATLSGLLVLGQPQTPETHKAVITFEWPAKGEKIKTDKLSKK